MGRYLKSGNKKNNSQKIEVFHLSSGGLLHGLKSQQLWAFGIENDRWPTKSNILIIQSAKESQYNKINLLYLMVCRLKILFL